MSSRVLQLLAIIFVLFVCSASKDMVQTASDLFKSSEASNLKDCQSSSAHCHKPQDILEGKSAELGTLARKDLSALKNDVRLKISADPVQRTLTCTAIGDKLQWSDTANWVGTALPVAGDNVTIGANCWVELDANATGLNTLIVEGVLSFKEEDRTLSAKFIWVKGQMYAGNETTAFPNSLTIQLLGASTDPVHVIDQDFTWSKSLVVTGQLKLYGKVTSSLNTRLTSTALAGATTLNVASTDGWVIGQTIGISPSFSNPAEFEKVTITALDATSITFATPLAYTHYGAATGLTNAIGDIDMRSVAVLLDRNIKITNDDTATWSYSVLVYGLNSSGTVKTGSVVLKSVQFKNGGQANTDKAALNVINTAIGTTETVVISNSVFESCVNYCVYLKNSKGTTINNNLLFEGQRYLTYTEGASSHTFTSNVLVGAKKRTGAANATENIACYHQSQTPVVTSVTVTDNVCQGSEGVGFIIPFIDCGTISATDGYSGNTAGSAKIGFLVTDNAATGCKGAGYLKAYGCEVGITSNPIATRVTWQNLILADNKRALGLRYGVTTTSLTSINNLDLKDSWILGVSRTDCPECYGVGKTSCSDLNALRLLVVTAGAATTALDDSIQQITTPEQLDANAWISNVIFQNFKLSYSALANNLSTVCSNNRLFEVHPQADSAIGNHHLTNTTCTGCEVDAYGYFSAPIAANLGNAGGCGSTLCTGRYNYLIADHTGGLVGGTGGTITPNNSLVFTLDGCVLNAKTNGLVCTRTDIGRLKFASIAKDFQTRVNWPVTLTKDSLPPGSAEINGWKEYEWNGTTPANKRLARFLALIQYAQCHNMSFTAQPSTDMLFSLSVPTADGDNSKWTCVRLRYPVINSVSVTLTDGTKPSSILGTNVAAVTSTPTVCGASKYLYKDGIVNFIVTGSSDCVVRVTLTSSLQMTIRLSTAFANFQANELSTFITNLATFLQIPASRIIVNGLTEGSTIVDLSITPVPTPVATSTSVDPALQATLDELATVAARASTATTTNIPNLLGVSSVTTVMNGSGQHVVTDTGSNSKRNAIIIGCVVGGVGLIGLIIGAYFLIKKLKAGSSAGASKVDEHSMNTMIQGTDPNIGRRN